MDSASSLRDLEAAEDAHRRVSGEIEAVTLDALAPMNVDVVSATSLVLGVADRILAYRDRLAAVAQSGEFDLKSVDNLVDYAKAAWYTYITNLPEAKPAELDALVQDVLALRSKLLMWAAPLVTSGRFDQVAIDKIKDGAGYKDAASDVVALVGLFRSKWDEVESICDISEDDLERGARIAPSAFALLSRRDHQLGRATSEDSLRVRQAWTLLDNAYSECQRGLTFLRWAEGDAKNIAPSLRHNPGPRGGASSSSGSSSSAPASEVESSPPAPQAPAGGLPIGGGDGPFAAEAG